MTPESASDLEVALPVILLWNDLGTESNVIPIYVIVAPDTICIQQMMAKITYIRQGDLYNHSSPYVYQESVKKKKGKGQKGSGPAPLARRWCGVGDGRGRGRRAASRIWLLLRLELAYRLSNVPPYLRWVWTSSS